MNVTRICFAEGGFFTPRYCNSQHESIERAIVPHHNDMDTQKSINIYISVMHRSASRASYRKEGNLKRKTYHSYNTFTRKIIKHLKIEAALNKFKNFRIRPVL